jgi:protein-disulfide isomerase
VQGKQEGQRIGISGTPAIYINGKKHNGYSEQELSKTIEALL